MTRAETETTFRWDNEERTLWAGTTDPFVAERWRRLGFATQAIGHVQGEAVSWEIRLPHAKSKRPWISIFSVAIPHWGVEEAGEIGDEDALSCSSHAPGGVPGGDDGAN